MARVSVAYEQQMLGPDSGLGLKASCLKHDTWVDLKHPPGIQVLHKWETQPKNQGSICGYMGWNVYGLLTFVDNVGKS